MKNLITKLVKFLTKYCNDEVLSFERFNNQVKDIANGRYFVVYIERKTYSSITPSELTFKIYLESYDIVSASTPELAILKLKEMIDKPEGKEVQVLC